MGLIDKLRGKKKERRETKQDAEEKEARQRLEAALNLFNEAMEIYVNFNAERIKSEEQPTVSKSTPPRFVRKYTQRAPTGHIMTYEIYEGTNAESAKEFLQTKTVDNALHYIVVETPEGNWGVDAEGLYLERLLPWQRDITTAECEGRFVPLSWSSFGLQNAAKGFNDNFVLKVQCGKCSHEWIDGVRYQNVTVVRCPCCRTLNKIDTERIKVAIV